MNSYEKLKKELLTSQKTWLITGVAGFIGSNLLETLLNLNQKVVGLDNFSTGHQKNIDEALTAANLCSAHPTNYQPQAADPKLKTDNRWPKTIF